MDLWFFIFIAGIKNAFRVTLGDRYRGKVNWQREPLLTVNKGHSKSVSMFTLLFFPAPVTRHLSAMGFKALSNNRWKIYSRMVNLKYSI